MVVTTTPAGIFTLIDAWEITMPRPRCTSPRRSPTAQLLQFLLTNDIENWSAIDLSTLEALYEETLAYPTWDDSWDDEDDLERPIDHAFNNAWHVVCAGSSLVPYQRLPIIPVLTHPFY